MSLKFKNEKEFQEWLNRASHIKVLMDKEDNDIKNKNIYNSKIDQEESIVIYIPITLVLLVIIVFGVLFFLGKV